MARNHASSGQAPGRDRDSYDADAEWFILCGSSAMGERGTLAGVVSVLELGGGNHGGVPNTHLYNDQQLGLGTNVIGQVERHRWLSAAWALVDEQTRGVLLACYTAPAARYRADQGFGARDVCPAVEDVQRGAVEPSRGRHRPTHTGVDAQLGDLAALCFRITDDPAKLLQACMQPGKGKNGRTIRRELRRARDAARIAHKVWRAYKQLARNPRSTSERRAVLPRHDRVAAEAAEVVVCAGRQHGKTARALAVAEAFESGRVAVVTSATQVLHADRRGEP